ncbi:MAG: hypothetical protein Q8P62_02420 [Candidatus Peregrinibacteria bacterium]|nr:hypothetical protein [Candidatus Peregrinibacteria bacterium]
MTRQEAPDERTERIPASLDLGDMRFGRATTSFPRTKTVTAMRVQTVLVGHDQALRVRNPEELANAIAATVEMMTSQPSDSVRTAITDKVKTAIGTSPLQNAERETIIDAIVEAALR